jgi:NADH:ubiquinone oxidoreductase subunit 5 (subunit L)/multisubunit Na+/H+ antiporter MnhA subunit
VFLVVGIVGAVLTAAYMTRCVYLTFFGEYRGGHAHLPSELDEAEHSPDMTAEAIAVDEHTHRPHESNSILTAPLFILSAFAVFIGFLQIPNFTKFEEWSLPRAPEEFLGILHGHEFNVFVALLSVSLALFGFAVAWFYYEGRLPALENLSQRNALAARGKALLVNKFYLDDLYEKVVVGAVIGPIARGAYWLDRVVIDNVLNFTGRSAARAGQWTYKRVDQGVVDGFVNGIATVTGETGGAVRRVQTGRLQFYAFMLVAATAAFALILWIFT